MAEQQLERIWRFVLILIPYALIYSIQISNGLILLLLSTSLVYFFATTKKVGNLRYFFLLSIPFWVTLWGLAYSTNLKVGASILETRAPMILFPIIFYLKPPNSIDQSKLLKHFILSLLATFFILLAIAVYRNSKDPWANVWFNQWYYHYDNLTEPIDMQPLYLALFVSFGLVLVLMNHLDSSKFDIIRSKRVRWAMLLVFSVFLVMLGVRSILIVTVCLVGLAFVRNKFFTRKNLSIAGVLVLGLIGLSILSPVTSERFEGLLKQQYNFSKYSVDRFVIWSIATKHIKSNPLQFVFGNGTGTSEQTMDGLYKAEGIEWDFEKKTNTHNQYIEFVLDTGFFGALLLFLYLVILFFRFSSSQNRIGEILVTLLFLAMISENYLNRQKGVVFFSLFLCLLAFQRDSPLSDDHPGRIPSNI